MLLAIGPLGQGGVFDTLASTLAKHLLCAAVATPALASIMAITADSAGHGTRRLLNTHIDDTLASNGNGSGSGSGSGSGNGKEPPPEGPLNSYSAPFLVDRVATPYQLLPLRPGHRTGLPGWNAPPIAPAPFAALTSAFRPQCEAFASLRADDVEAAVAADNARIAAHRRASALTATTSSSSSSSSAATGAVSMSARAAAQAQQPPPRKGLCARTREAFLARPVRGTPAWAEAE